MPAVVFALCCHLGVKADRGFWVGEKNGATNVFSNRFFEVQWVVLLTVASVFKIYLILLFMVIQELK